METLIKADIFFFISSIATIVIAIFISALLYYLIKAGKALHELLEDLRGNYEDSEEYVNELVDRLEANAFFRMIFPPIHRKKKTKSKTKKNDADEKETV